MELEEPGSLTSDYTTNYRHQNSIVLAQKQKYRSIEQTESPGRNPCTYDQLIYGKRDKTIQWRKGRLFNR